MFTKFQCAPRIVDVCGLEFQDDLILDLSHRLSNAIAKETSSATQSQLEDDPRRALGGVRQPTKNDQHAREGCATQPLRGAVLAFRAEPKAGCLRDPVLRRL